MIWLGFEKKFHQPVAFETSLGMIEVTNRPAVGISHRSATITRMTLTGAFASRCAKEPSAFSRVAGLG